jgi:hypothetical protein
VATQIAKQKGLLNEILCQKWMCQNIKTEDINRKRNEIVRVAVARRQEPPDFVARYVCKFSFEIYNDSL